MGVTIEWSTEPAERARTMEAEARRMAAALADLGALLVVLFGSRATGRARAGSDIDIIAVMHCDPSWTFARRLAEIGSIVDPRFATDLLVYTPEEFARLRDESPFVREALATGRILYERGTGGDGPGRT